MKNAELIAELQKHPADAEVTVNKLPPGVEYCRLGSVEIGCYIGDSTDEGVFFEHADPCDAPGDGCVKAVCLTPAT